MSISSPFCFAPALAVIAVIAVISLMTTSVSAQQTIQSVAPATAYQEVAEKLDRLIVEQVDQNQIPSFSIALVVDQDIVWAKGFGFENREKNRRATAQTIYRVGSVSKLFTDLAIMQQVEQGKIDLDASATEYVKEFAPKSNFKDTITLRQLMSHRSGLVRESPVGHYFDPEEPTLAATVESLNLTQLVYRPTSRTKYSNAGVSVVGLALERQLKLPFADAIRQSVLSPLGMDHSSFELDSTVKPHLSDAVMWTLDGRTFPAPSFALGTSPAGNLYSNVIDLSKFMKAIFNGGEGERGRVLKSETLKQMMSPQFSRENGSFGLGFHIDQFEGHKLIGHGGAVYGFSTQFEALPDEKVGVITVSAMDGSNGLARRIANEALRGLLASKNGKPIPYPINTIEIDPKRALLFDGRFVESEGDKVIELIERNGSLQLKRGSVLHNLKSSEGDFIVDDVQQFGTRIKLHSPDLISIDDTTYQRVERSLPAKMPKRWESLVGEYGWDHNTLFVFERDGVLHGLIEWFYDYPLSELSKDRFAFPDYGLYHGEELLFDRGDEGEVLSVTAAEVVFHRREIGVKDGETFRIVPTKPIEEVRKIALAGKPPKASKKLFDADLVELTQLDDSIKLDIRYATTNNFMGAVFYKQGRAFLQRPAAEALVRTHQRLKKQGYGLLIHDAYRPWFVTKMFWEATPSEQKIFVANPANGSRHNRGCAVDLTLYDLKTGFPIPMGAGYDEFSARSFPDYAVATSRQRWHRELLRDSMEAAGFTIYEFEWWHFDYKTWEKYPILNLRFEEL